MWTANRRTGRENTLILYCPRGHWVSEPMQAGGGVCPRCSGSLSFVRYEAGVEEAAARAAIDADIAPSLLRDALSQFGGYASA